MNEIEAAFPHLSDLPPKLDDSVAGTPDRRPGSVRRTSTLDMVWPDGFGTPLQLIGRARDLLTNADEEPSVLGEAKMKVRIDNSRTVTSIEVIPERPEIEGLVGAKGGSELRSAIDKVLPNERESATPLYLLLDDIAGTSLIAGFAWSRSKPEVRKQMSGAGSRKSPGTSEFYGMRKGKIICSGLRPNGWADSHWKLGKFANHTLASAGDISTPDDPYGWHELEPVPEVGMRRHRRIDVWRQDGALAVDAFFRDICWDPDGTQQVIHEYSVDAVVDPVDHTLVSAEATPRVLPFPECQWAAPHAAQLVGMPVADFRSSVQQTLTELKACTHLNDMLRALAEVPALAAHL